jgi:aerobic C4-dicarboxylate transport protein
VENEILRVLVLAILTAAAVSGLPKVQREQVVGVFDVASKVIFRIIRLIMWAAPIGAFGGMAFTVAKFGGASLTSLGVLMATFWGTCAVFVFGVLGLVSRLSGFSIFRLIRLIRDELLIIVGTSSSETVLPRLLAKLEAAGASRRVTGVVIPTGYSFNLDGTCIHLTLGALFIIQAAGQDMPLETQIGLLALMGADLEGRRGDHGRRARHADRVAAGVRRRLLQRRVDRRRHRARGRDRSHHERGPRAHQRDRQLRRDDGDRQVQGELDEEKFQEALRSPGRVERATDAALAGAAA